MSRVLRQFSTRAIRSQFAPLPLRPANNSTYYRSLAVRVFPTSKGLSTLSLARGPSYEHANSGARACPSGYTPCTAKNYAGSCVLPADTGLASSINQRRLTIITRVFETITRERSHSITGNERAFPLVVDAFRSFSHRLAFPCRL